jgi:uncharacterized membrane protein
MFINSRVKIACTVCVRSTKSIGIFRNGFIGRKRLLWIIVGIFAAILVITAIVILTAIVLKRKDNVSSTTTVTIKRTASMKTTTKKPTEVPLTTKHGG